MTDNMITEPKVEAPVVKTPEVKAPEVKTPDVKTPEVKPAEINWQDRATQAEEKLKGVDLDKWAKVKDLDPDEVSEAMKAYGIMSEDEGKFKKVMAILEAREEVKVAEAAGKDTTALESKLKSLEDKVNYIEKAEQKKMEDGWMERYGKKFDSVLDGQKEVAKLSPLERRAVRNYVDSRFREDKRSGKPSLGIPDVEKFVAEAVKEVKEHRAFILSESVKTDSSPDGIAGNRSSGSPVEKKKKLEAADRIGNMQKEFAQIQADKAHVT